MKFLFLLLLTSIIYGQTQTEMNEESVKKYKTADKELNEVYSKVIKTLTAEEKKLLVVAQKNWIKFRDSDCKVVEKQYEGGSIQFLIYNTCLIDKTKARIEELKTMLANRAN